ncbi:hypothetical protein AVP42_02502 [Agromyces sp. NDB4Y10]|nr:hypothetical protein AVP42_02502 [Agromyces sp. NDB4Y10]
MLAGGLAGKGVCDTRDKDGVHRSLLPVSARWALVLASIEATDAAWRGPHEHTPVPRHP